ncbi:MAG: CHAT domain-containing protein [Planctomycetia bacterium]|nr:CHAT domain-containing protein [Planctomycetia bacterium]
MALLDSDSRRELNRRLGDLFRQGRFRDALVQVEGSLAECEDDTPADLDRAESLEWLGRLRRELGLYAQAEPPLLQALSFRAALSGKEDPAYARCLHELALLYEELAQYAQAEPLYRSALAIRRKVLGEDHPEVADSLHDFASFQDLLARYTEAAELHRVSREIRLNRLGEEHPDYAKSLAAEAWECCRKGDLLQGEALARKAYTIVEKTRGPIHPQRASGAHLLSRIALQQARVAEAEEYALCVTEVRREILGERHHRYAGGLENLAFVRAMQGRTDEAERLARQGVEITRTALGERHPFFAEGLTAVAFALQTQQNYSEAEKLYRQALEVFRTVHGERHIHVAGCLRDLAEVCASRESNDQAEEHFREALTIIEPRAESSPLEYVELLEGLSRVLAAQGRLDDALEAAQRAVDVARQTSDNSALLAGSLEGLARVSQARGDLGQAAKLWREAITRREHTGGPDHPSCAEGLRNLAAVQQMMGQMAPAVETLQHATDMLRRALGGKHPETLATLSALADAKAQLGDLAAAEEILIETVDLERERVGDDHPDYGRSVQQLGRLYLTMNNIPAAEVRYREVLSIFRKAFGEEHPEYARAVQDLAMLYHQVGDLGSASYFYRIAADIRREDPGEDHPEFAESAMGLAQVYQAMNQLDEAEPLLRQAVEVYRTAMGEDAPPTLRARHLLALFLQARGDLSGAVKELGQASDRLEEVVGDKSPILTPLLTDLARLVGQSGDQLRAEQLYRRIQIIHRAAFPDDTALQVQDLVNLAMAHRTLGELSSAENNLREAIVLLSRLRGSDHPDTLAVMGLLAGTLFMKEDLAQARQVYEDTLERTRSVLGQVHSSLISLQSELAGLCLACGQSEEALRHFREAAERVQATQGEDNAEFINLLRLQAGVLQILERHAEAETLLKQRITILRRLFGLTSPVLAPAQQLLADLYSSMKRLDEAEVLSRQILQTMRRAGRPNVSFGTEDELSSTSSVMVPPPVSLSLAENNLATICLAKGQFAEAETLLRRAVQSCLEAVGDEHPTTSMILFHLACAVLGAGRMNEALMILEQLTAREARLWPQLMSLIPDQARAIACQSLHDTYESFLSLCTQQHASENPEGGISTGRVVARILGLVLRRKRTGVEILGATAWPLWGDRYPRWSDELRRYALIDRQIAARRWSGPLQEGIEAHEIVLAEWIQRRDRIEDLLADQIPEVALRRKLWGVTLESVEEHIPPGFTVVEFLHFRERNFSTLFSHDDKENAVRGRYLVFVIKPGADGPWMIDLGPAPVLDAMAIKWRTELEKGKSSPDAAGLRAAIVDRIWPLIADSTGLVLAADGELITLPLDVLPCEGGLLIDRFQTQQLLCSRDLLRRGKPMRDAEQAVLVPGEPKTSLWASWKKYLGGDQDAALVRRINARIASNWGPSPLLLHIESSCWIKPGEPRPGPWANPLNQSALNVQEGQLTARGITAQDLWACRSVMLAGLSTPFGVPGAWPRMSGLLASFVTAGANAVTYALWQSPSRAKQYLIEEYYRGLLDNLTAPEALRQAKMKTRKRWPSVAAWAGWVCLGEMA